MVGHRAQLGVDEGVRFSFVINYWKYHQISLSPKIRFIEVSKRKSKGLVGYRAQLGVDEGLKFRA